MTIVIIVIFCLKKQYRIMFTECNFAMHVDISYLLMLNACSPEVNMPLKPFKVFIVIYKAVSLRIIFIANYNTRRFLDGD